ncbi:MAG: LCP family protein [Dysosmobacter sp.]
MENHREEKRTGGSRQEKKAKKAGKKSRLTRQQKILLAVAVVLALVVVAVAACQSLFVRPDLENKPSKTEEDEVEEIDYGDGVRPRSDGERKSEDYYTVLILGRDTGGGGNTDTMLLASYDVTNQKATVMSIPRDTMVNVPWDIKRINSVYNYYGGGDKGIQALYKEISQLVGFEPDYQVIVEWEAVGEIVDAMGGVWFEVPRDMNYDDPYQDLHIHQEAGYRLLSGDDAMQVLRYRHDNKVNGVMKGYPDGDLGRIKTQQAFLQAMVEQMLQVKNITKINDFIKVVQDNVETDLSFQNMLWFGQQAVLGGLKIENVNFVTMPNKNVSCWSRTYYNYQSYVTPIASELLDLVNNELSPYVETFTMSDLDIMSVNSDGSVSSSTGYVEDKKAASPPVKPSTTTPAEEEPEETEPVVDENGNPVDPEGGTTTDPGNGSGTVTDPGTEGGTSGTEGGTSTEGGTAGTEGGSGTGTGTESGSQGSTGTETGTQTGGSTGTETGTEGSSGNDAGGQTGTENTGTSGESGTGDSGQTSGTEGTTEPGFSIIEQPPAA